MQAILGNAELVVLDLDEGRVDRVRENAAEIVTAVEEMQFLVQQMLNLGKPVQSKEDELDLGEETNRILDLLNPLKVLQRCQVITDFDSNLPSIKADAAQIEQALRNLLVNASHAVEQEVVRRITLSARPDETRTRVIYTIEDNGCGIPPELKDKMFQPFFTTKPDGQGTGLGLSIVKTILDRHGASVRVDSTVGKGTCFTLTFPAGRRGAVHGEGTRDL
jgi:signal transduction histidine kinase